MMGRLWELFAFLRNIRIKANNQKGNLDQTAQQRITEKPNTLIVSSNNFPSALQDATIM